MSPSDTRPGRSQPTLTEFDPVPPLLPDQLESNKTEAEKLRDDLRALLAKEKSSLASHIDALEKEKRLQKLGGLLLGSHNPDDKKQFDSIKKAVTDIYKNEHATRPLLNDAYDLSVRAHEANAGWLSRNLGRPAFLNAVNEALDATENTSRASALAGVIENHPKTKPFGKNISSPYWEDLPGRLNAHARTDPVYNDRREKAIADQIGKDLWLKTATVAGTPERDRAVKYSYFPIVALNLDEELKQSKAHHEILKNAESTLESSPTEGAQAAFSIGYDDQIRALRSEIERVTQAAEAHRTHDPVSVSQSAANESRESLAQGSFWDAAAAQSQSSGQGLSRSSSESRRSRGARP